MTRPALAASRTSRPARTALALGLLVAGLSGCGNGLEPQVYAVRELPNGTNAQAGPLAVRNLRLLPPADGTYTRGEDARAAMVVVNSTGEDDALVGASSEAAGSVALTAGGAQVAEIAVPAHGRSAADAQVILRGLTRDLRPGTYVQLELVFRDAGRTSVLVPVETTGTPEPRPTVFPLPPVDSEGRPVGGHADEGIGEGGRGNQESETGGAEGTEGTDSH